MHMAQHPPSESVLLWMEYTAEKSSIYGQAVPGQKFGDTIMYI